MSTPVNHEFYLNAHQGAGFGLDHSRQRFDPFQVSLLRPETGINGINIYRYSRGQNIQENNYHPFNYILRVLNNVGLFLTGQDIMTAGMSPSICASLICAGAVVERQFETVFHLIQMMKNIANNLQ